MGKKVRKVTKNTVIKSIEQEYLMPDSWENDFDSNGNKLKGSSKYKNCTVCAVGAVIVGLKKRGKIKSFAYNISITGNTRGKNDSAYYKALVSNGLCLTALSDMFETECLEQGICSVEWESALVNRRRAEEELNEIKNGRMDWLTRKDKAEIKKLFRASDRTVRGYEKKMKKIKKKLISFVKKEFPFYVDIAQESYERKLKAIGVV